MQLTLLGEFGLNDRDGAIAVAPASARVIAYLSLSDRRAAPRRLVAQALWPDRSHERAMANLRAAIWRMPERARPSVSAFGENLRTSPELEIDIDRFGADVQLEPADVVALAAPLLPSWYDEWVIRERERFDLRRIDALERSATQCVSGRRFAEALDLALAAIELEPYRESVHRIVLRSHICEGNVSEAVAHFEWLDAMFVDELGFHPSNSTRAVLGSVTASRRTS